MQKYEVKNLETSSNSRPPYLVYSHNASHSVPVFSADNDDVSRKQDGGHQIYTWIAFFVVPSQFPWKLLKIIT